MESRLIIIARFWTYIQVYIHTFILCSRRLACFISKRHVGKSKTKEWVSGHAITEKQQKKGSLGRHVVSIQSCIKQKPKIRRRLFFSLGPVDLPDL
jgi:HD superfamily phosphohydrolase